MMLFIYDLLPAGLFHLILFIGIIGSLITTFMPNIPFVGAYQSIVKLIAIACLALGLVWYGIGESEAKWAAKNAALDLKITQLESRAPIITEKIVTEYVDREKIIKLKGENLVIKVPYYVSVESDRSCPVPAGFVRLLNEAAKNSGLPDATSGTDAKGQGATPAAGATGKPE